MTFEIEFTEKALNKNQNGRTIDQIELSHIKKVDRVKRGLLIESKWRKTKFFIPNIIEGFDDLQNKIEEITIANRIGG